MKDALFGGINAAVLTAMKPDFTPDKYVPADPRVFKPEDTFAPTDPKFERRRKAGPTMPLDDPDFVESLRKK